MSLEDSVERLRKIMAVEERDVVERLRASHGNLEAVSQRGVRTLYSDAADEIEMRRAQVERLVGEVEELLNRR